MPQFAATIKHLREGEQGFTIDAAVKNIESWKADLAKLEAPGAKALAEQLDELGAQLRAGTIDNGKVKPLMLALGEATVRFAGTAGGGKAGEIRALGEALTFAAGHLPG